MKKTGVPKMIAEHQSYIDALKKRDAETLKRSLYENLAERIEGISRETDFYIV